MSKLRELIRLRNNDLFPFVISQHGIFGIRICLMSNLRSHTLVISRFFSYFWGSYNYTKVPSLYYVRTLGWEGGSENGNFPLLYVLKMSLHSKKSCTYANLPLYKGYLIPVTPFIKIEINMSKNQNKLHEDFGPTVLRRSQRSL